jgi:hypothetical protein
VFRNDSLTISSIVLRFLNLLQLNAAHRCRQSNKWCAANTPPAYMYPYAYISFVWVFVEGRGRRSISRFPPLANCVCFVLCAPRYGVKLDPSLGPRRQTQNSVCFTLRIYGASTSQILRSIASRLWHLLRRQCVYVSVSNEMGHGVDHMIRFLTKKLEKLNIVASVRERPPLVGKVSANFCG